MDTLLSSFSVLGDPQNMALMVIAVMAGIIVGAIPGLTPAIAIGVLIPFTFSFNTDTAFVLLLGIYVGSMYGGSVPAILMGLPGTPSAAVTTADGFPLTRQGRAGEALGVSILSGTIGGVISCVLLVFLSRELAQVALRFGGPEYFSLCLFATTVVFVFSSPSLARGIIAACLGLLLSTIGIDPITPFPRFTFGMSELMIGVPLVPATIGLFCVAEVFRMIESPGETPPEQSRFSGMRTAFPLLPSLAPTIFRSSIIGTLVGVLPGTGATVASYLSYNAQRSLSKERERFGNGSEEGVAASESANNASTGGTMIPLLALGIPGDINTLLLLGAMFVHGLIPGPGLFTDHADLVYVIFGTMILSNLLIFVLGMMFTRWVAAIAAIRKRYLIPVILIISITGPAISYGHVYYFWLTIIFGIIGYLCQRGGFPVLAVAMGLILGPIMETNFRSSLMLPGADLGMFFSRPISGGFLVLTLAILAYAVWREVKLFRQTRTPASAEST
ncbi:tripartite tricarboxylate transporter permease [Martelella limonii]|uniref:tripartite tricarboxylate transporter permease n=1 Tax=Martelella limonii TaxID=1647649 RepID=UPI001580C017|nr:tripartite tricarboxylate transporter permease [Martelella limonii]